MKGRSGNFWFRVALLSFFNLVCCSGGVVYAQSLQHFAPEGYVDLDGIWPSRIIPVCWELRANHYEEEKDWVKSEVIATIQRNSSIVFIGWNECNQAELGIRIRIADVRPRSAVGRQWKRDASGKKIQNTVGQFVQLPTKMVLNFTFHRTRPYSHCRQDREHCIRAIAVHEFLHAVGFLHEQLRSDAPNCCKQRFAHNSDFSGYRPMFGTREYDPDSHVNYCKNMYRKPIELSTGDIAVLNKFYTFQ